jgi:hypothetical protein
MGRWVDSFKKKRDVSGIKKDVAVLQAESNKAIRQHVGLDWNDKQFSKLQLDIYAKLRDLSLRAENDAEFKRLIDDSKIEEILKGSNNNVSKAKLTNYINKLASELRRKKAA